jgi:hypothetical protein
LPPSTVGFNRSTGVDLQAATEILYGRHDIVFKSFNLGHSRLTLKAGLPFFTRITRLGIYGTTPHLPMILRCFPNVTHIVFEEELCGTLLYGDLVMFNKVLSANPGLAVL